MNKNKYGAYGYLGYLYDNSSQKTQTIVKYALAILAVGLIFFAMSPNSKKETHYELGSYEGTKAYYECKLAFYRVSLGDDVQSPNSKWATDEKQAKSFEFLPKEEELDVIRNIGLAVVKNANNLDVLREQSLQSCNKVGIHP